jgi:phenylpropionate dioxygenase-like ring-hydroxylating dioxygenase large terminal subunit
MDQQNVANAYAAVEHEGNRTAYPDDFPVLPEISAGRYFEQEFHDLEKEHIWRRTWLSAAHLSELSEPGSYKLFEQLGLSVIVIRGLDGAVRAFHNVCRHRGAALLLDEKGSVRRLICPYHAWSYSLEGELVVVPEAHNFAGLDKSQRPLVPLRCEVWRGFVFINLDDGAEPLADFLEPISKQIADFPLDDMVVKGVFSLEIDCNWKVAFDNFLEIYHVNTVHPKSLAPYVDSKSFTVELLENGHGCFTTRKRGGMSLRKDAKPSDEGNEQSNFANRFKDHSIGLPFFPNGFTVLDPMGFPWQTFWPKGPDKMVMVTMMMGWKKDDDEDRMFWEQTKVSLLDVFNEDLRLFGGIQRSLSTGKLPAILVGYQEQHIYWYHEEIDRRIGVGNLSPHLRVSQLLAAQAGGA